MDLEIVAGFKLIGTKRGTIHIARATAEAHLKGMQPKLIGRRYEPFKLGRLKGLYEITSVRLNLDCEVEAVGRKVLANGKLGSQAWDLGVIVPGRLA